MGLSLPFQLLAPAPTWIGCRASLNKHETIPMGRIFHLFKNTRRIHHNEASFSGRLGLVWEASCLVNAHVKRL
jgi:hypothetical protein